jgi:hypothetical protein
MPRTTKRVTALKTTLLHSEPGNELILAAIEEMLVGGECPTRAAAVRLMLYERAKQRLGIRVCRDTGRFNAEPPTIGRGVQQSQASQTFGNLSASSGQLPAESVLHGVEEQSQASVPVVALKPTADERLSDRIRRLTSMAVSEDVVDPSEPTA